MIENSKYRKYYSLSDIEKYLKGNMTTLEMNTIEKAALLDPFLADAIDGYNNASLQISHQHLREIEQALLAENEDTKIISINNTKQKQWRIVASVAVLLGIGIFSWIVTHNNNVQKNIANNQPATITSKDSAIHSAITYNTKTDNNKIAGITKQKESEDKNVFLKKTDPTNSKSQTAVKTKIAKSKIEDRKLITSIVLAPPTISESIKDIAYNKKAHSKINIDKTIQTRISSDSNNNLNKSLATNTAPLKSENANIALRGTNNNNEPLYIINGIIRKKIPNLDTNNLDTITVLKGPVAIALYGNKAANGIIVISTKLRGRVTNVKDEGIAYASVNVDNSGKIITTDRNGLFTINHADTSAMITVSYIGFIPQKSLVKINSNNIIVLKENQTQLKEEVVVGYNAKERLDNPTPENNISSNKVTVPVDDWDNFNNYVVKKMNNPNLYGEVRFRFRVNKKGNIRQVKIINSLFTKPINEQIKNIILQGPKLNPAHLQGEAVIRF